MGTSKQGLGSDSKPYSFKEEILSIVSESEGPGYALATSRIEYDSGNNIERISIIRKGLLYETIELLSCKAGIPIKQLLVLFDIPQTTYNKKKRDKEYLDGRDSELLLILSDLLDFGIDVFNNEIEKFQRWLKKPNTSLGGIVPSSLFDTLTGIQVVKNCLLRLEYGNIA